MKIFLKNPESFNTLLIEKGFTKSSLARSVGMNKAHSIMISNGKRNVGPVIAKKVAEVLGVDFYDIFFIESVSKHEQTEREVKSVGM